MAIGGLELPQISQILVSPNPPIRKDIGTTRLDNDAPEKTKEQSTLRGPSPTQDQVTLSQEAQILSVANSKASENSTFQQSPSPFDR